MIRRSDKQNLGSGVALNTCMNNSRCLAQNVVLLFNIQFRCQNVLVTGKFKHTMKYARIKYLCIETCLFKKDRYTANFQKRQKLH